MVGASSSHLTGKIVSHVLKTAYPTGQPGSFSREIADLLAQLDTVSSEHHASSDHTIRRPDRPIR